MLIETLEYDDLTADEKAEASGNGCGREEASYLKVSHNGETIALESDAMEPEDARMFRDLSWIQPLLQRVWEIGKAEA